MVELGNSQKAIPFYAIYAPGLDKPITFSGLITSSGVIKELSQFTQARSESASATSPKVAPIISSAAAN
ncbi:MAG: hypothetical protein VYE64_08420 [Planctomycetota bacterium]|nr:hypothetical protein [Planctomycetota bacterium]